MKYNYWTQANKYVSNKRKKPKFRNPKEMEKKIEEYFDIWHNQVEEYEYDWEAVIKARPTLTWLALYLGFPNTEAFWKYKNEPKYAEIVARAYSCIEQYYEEHLLSKYTKWSSFALRNIGNWEQKEKFEHDVRQARVQYEKSPFENIDEDGNYTDQEEEN